MGCVNGLGVRGQNSILITEQIRSKEVIVSDNRAYELLLETILQFKESGETQVDVIDLHAHTKLPIEQVSRLMIRLEKNGVIRSNDES